MPLYNICAKREHEKDGDKKTFWNRVGILKITPGKRPLIRLFMFPGTELYSFEADRTIQEAEEKDIISS